MKHPLSPMRTELVKLFAAGRMVVRQQEGLPHLASDLRCKGHVIPCNQELEASYLKPRKSVKGGWGKGNIVSELDIQLAEALKVEATLPPRRSGCRT